MPGVSEFILNSEALITKLTKRLTDYHKIEMPNLKRFGIPDWVLDLNFGESPKRVCFIER